jgi:hypothetical protein
MTFLLLLDFSSTVVLLHYTPPVCRASAQSADGLRRAWELRHCRTGIATRARRLTAPCTGSINARFDCGLDLAHRHGIVDRRDAAASEQRNASTVTERPLFHRIYRRARSMSRIAMARLGEAAAPKATANLPENRRKHEGESRAARARPTRDVIAN